MQINLHVCEAVNSISSVEIHSADYEYFLVTSVSISIKKYNIVQK